MYTLYIDESGDQGLDRVRDETNSYGASPFLTLGAALVPNKLREDIRDDLNAISKELKGKELHCADLSHFDVSYFARRIKQQQILLFGVVSKKSTLGDYRENISGEKQSQDYYNKCVQYLLELVGRFMSEHKYKSDNLSVVFEKRNHDYDRMRRYIKAIREKPIDARARFLQNIDPLSILAISKRDEDLLALGDLVAYALYQSVNICLQNHEVPEQRYIREIKSKFWKNPSTGQIANFGIKYIKGPIQMGLSGEELKFAMKFYNKMDCK